MSKNLLILTVGTGTAGKTSNLAEGLRRTIDLLAPRQFWLVPSTTEDSQVMAALVSENQPSFAGQASLDAPDDLEACRKHLRTVIRDVRKNLKSGEKLLINPTSGTKQMTAAATLAALDEGIGHIVFTTGERADGVVKTGTEQVTGFDPSHFFFERDLLLAKQFFKEGDFHAAGRVLEPHKSKCPKEYTTAYACHHWRRFDYREAQKFASHLAREKVADHLAWAKHACEHHDYDTTIRLTYKALELKGRWLLETKWDLKPGKNGLYKKADVEAISPSVAAAQNRKQFSLGLANIVKILTDVEDPFGCRYEGRLANLSELRNESTHDIRPVTKDEAKEYLDLATNHIGIKPSHLPTSLTDAP